MAQKKAVKTSTPKLRLTVRHALTDIYVLLMFTLFPLFLSNYYSAARRDKFWIFLVLTAIVGITVGILSIVHAFTKNSVYNQKLNTYCDPFRITATDCAFFAFVAVSVISALTSGRLAHCLVGLSVNDSGRNMGLITIILLLISYLVISRFFYFKKYIFYCIFGGITIVSLLAIFNYYYIDPLGMVKAYQNSTSYETVLLNFTSTIGNKNYLSAFICVALPFSLGVAITASDKVMKIVAYASMCIQYMGLIVATSDGGFLGFFFMLAVLAVVLCRNPQMLSKLCFAITLMAISAKLLKLFDTIMTIAGPILKELDIIMEIGSKGYTSFSDMVLNGVFSYLVIVAFALLTVLFGIIAKKRDNKPFPKAVLFIALGIVFVIATAMIGLVIFCTFIDTDEKLTGISRFFRFNDAWGTHRGYFWIRSFKIFSEDMNLWQKLFGTGPETFFFMFQKYFSEMSKLFNESSTNAAHNVYINYLITHGVLGLVAYLALVGSSVVLTIKRSYINPLALVCLCVIVTYAAQDFVNIANAVNTPPFFIFIALSEATLLRANSREHLEIERY